MTQNINSCQIYLLKYMYDVIFLIISAFKVFPGFNTHKYTLNLAATEILLQYTVLKIKMRCAP